MCHKVRDRTKSGLNSHPMRVQSKGDGSEKADFYTACDPYQRQTKERISQSLSTASVVQVGHVAIGRFSSSSLKLIARCFPAACYCYLL